MQLWNKKTSCQYILARIIVNMMRASSNIPHLYNSFCEKLRSRVNGQENLLLLLPCCCSYYYYYNYTTTTTTITAATAVTSCSYNTPLQLSFFSCHIPVSKTVRNKINRNVSFMYLPTQNSATFSHLRRSFGCHVSVDRDRNLSGPLFPSS
jgi:hypothetical protein